MRDGKKSSKEVVRFHLLKHIKISLLSYLSTTFLLDKSIRNS